jgi:arylsulfatase A-like enzyme
MSAATNARSLFRFVGIFLLVLGTGGRLVGAEKPLRRPNVLFILTDDQGYGDLSLHGNPHLKTPHLDALGHQGARFNRFFVSPLCAPSRASFLTGRYHLRTGVVSVSNGLEVMNADEVTLAEVLKANGYRTGCFGKWHNGEHLPHHPNGQGFDEFFGFCAGHWTNYFDTDLDHNGRFEQATGYLPDRLTDRAIAFMKARRGDARRGNAQPFFCYVPFNTPHSPHQVPDRYFNSYKAKGLSDELAAIYGMVENIDENVGRLMQTLKDLGIDRETIVIFSTDNGPNGQRFNAGMKGIKGSVDEGGVRVPFFIRWPGTIAPRLVRPIAAHVDLMPTLLELLDIRTPPARPFDGVSLVSQLWGDQPAPLPERTLYTHVAQLAWELYAVPAALRTERFRWVKTRQETALYDMTTDSLQKTNVIEKFPEQARAFEAQYARWFGEVSDNVNLAERPLPIGEGRQRQILPSHEARFSGKLRYQEGHGWAHDWLTNWQDEQDRIWWTVTNRRPRAFAVAIQYTCSAAAVGTVIHLETDSAQVRAAIQHPHDPPLRPSPDRKPRIEAFEKEWAIQPLGTLRIPAGQHRFQLRASGIRPPAGMEIKGLIITALPSQD